MTRPWLSMSRVAGVTAVDELEEAAAIGTNIGYTVAAIFAEWERGGPEGRGPGRR